MRIRSADIPVCGFRGFPASVFLDSALESAENRQARKPALLRFRHHRDSIQTMTLKDKILNPGDHCIGTSMGLLILRVVPGLMMLAHGWQKLAGFSQMSGQFPDPLGAGSAASLALVVFAEFFCSLAVILGIATRVVVIPIGITMLVAAFVIHGDDPWAKKEFALLYATVFLPLMFIGAGRYSLDAIVCKERGYASLMQSKEE